jgi:hypothetical protein
MRQFECPNDISVLEGLPELLFKPDELALQIVIHCGLLADVYRPAPE